MKKHKKNNRHEINLLTPIRKRIYWRMKRGKIPNIKVYKTDVKEISRAEVILKAIREAIPGCEPSFDLEDCDRVLRVENDNAPVNDRTIRSLVQSSGYQIEELL